MSWYSLYIRKSKTETVAETLRALLESHDYHPYDPFPGGTGTPSNLKILIRLFAAPEQDGWVRVLGQLDKPLLAAFSKKIGSPVLAGWLTDEDGSWAIFEAGEPSSEAAAFIPYLDSDHSAEELEQAFAGKLKVPVVSGSPLDAALPSDVRQLAEPKGVDSRQANKMFERISGELFGRMRRTRPDEASEQDQAREVLMGGGRDLWNSLRGQRVRAIASVLQLPSNWRLPSWETVRDAYHVHRLRERNPRAPLLPSDQEAFKSLSNALDYHPIYAGK